MTSRPLLVCLHALGASGRSFAPFTTALGDDFEVLAPDLPGFGDAAGDPSGDGMTVEDTVRHVLGLLRPHAGRRFLFVGHSMGAKIASIAAARILAGEPGVFGLAGMVLLAGSPPSPEPMAETRRAEMVQWATDGPLDGAAAREYVDANVGAPLPPDLDASALADVRRTSTAAWRAWLERGSREDWSDAVGTLELPAVLLAGSAGADLGPDAQRRLNAPVYPRARVRVLDGAGHLLPQERPEEVARIVAEFWREDAGRAPEVPVPAARLVASERTSARTRSVFAVRALADDPTYAPRALTAAQLTTLRAVAARVVPQDAPEIDLAARIDAQLAGGGGNGWRPDVLPPDLEAYRTALDALAGFAELDVEAQDGKLRALAAGTPLDDATVRDATFFSPAQWQAWFEDACDDLVRQWTGHPATLGAIGFDGFANGGDGRRLQGFSLLAAGEREPWEPVLPVRTAS